MSVASFDELVKQEQQAFEAGAGELGDHLRERDEWLVRLDDLYGQVEEFLGDYVQTGGVKIGYSPIEITEEQVGTYETRAMSIAIGRKMIRLEPIGAFLIGAKGRVDVVGARESGRIVLLDKAVKNISQLIRVSVSTDGKPTGSPPPRKVPAMDWVWRIMTRPPHMEIRELTKDSFLGLLAEVANG